MIVAQPPRLALHAVILVYAILLTGAAAAYQVSAALWIVTPLVAWIVLRAAVRDARRTTLAGIDIPELPDPLRGRVRYTFAQLPDGDARRLLLGVVNQARLLFARNESRFEASEDDRLREHVVSLVDACCNTAADLARIDLFTADASTGAAPGNDLVARTAKARALFRDRLTSAAAALAELYTSNVEKGTPSTDRVAELTSAIQEDAAARSAAVEEMRTLFPESSETPG